MRQPQIGAEELERRGRRLLWGMARAERPSGRLAHTAQALELGEALLERGQPEPSELLRRWSALQGELAPATGSTTARALRLHAEGFPADGLAEAAERQDPGDVGDGALPRVLPLAIAAQGDGRRLKAWAWAAAGVTHGDPLSRLGAVAACLLARDLLTRSLGESLARVAQALREEGPPRLAAILREPSPRDDERPSAAVLGSLWEAVHALPQGEAWSPPPRAAAAEGAGLALTGGLLGCLPGPEPERPAGLDQELGHRLDRLARGLAELAGRLPPLPPPSEGALWLGGIP